MDQIIERDIPNNNKTNEKQQNDINNAIEDFQNSFSNNYFEDEDEEDFEIYDYDPAEEKYFEQDSFLKDNNKYSNDQIHYFYPEMQNGSTISENHFFSLFIDEFEKNLNRIVKGKCTIKIPKTKLIEIYDTIRMKYATNPNFCYRKWHRITKTDERKRESILKKMMMNADIILLELQTYFSNKI